MGQMLSSLVSHCEDYARDPAEGELSLSIPYEVPENPEEDSPAPVAVKPVRRRKSATAQP